MQQVTLLRILIVLFIAAPSLHAQSPREIIELNGMAEFEQTKTALPPEKFTRRIPVPGLIDLAEPRIEQCDAYFSGTQEPRYSWYRFRFEVPERYRDRYAVLRIRKSRFDTQILLNGHDCGTYMQCNTPIRCDLTGFLVFGKENTLLVRVGERAWLPKESATGFDREKFTDIPGIWDDISISFAGPVQVDRALILPDLAGSKLTARIMLENLGKVVERNMEYSLIEYTLSVYIREKESGRQVTPERLIRDKIKCQQNQQHDLDLAVESPHAWSPDDPFLYEAVISVSADAKSFDDYGNPESLRPPDDYPWTGPSDELAVTFGMRDFRAAGRTFRLNGEQFQLLGSTITLNRFFEDRDRGALPWNEAWVRKLFVDIPKSLGWNGFRICIGLLPDFWYDLADEYGLLLQNEYPMWNLRGRDSQYREEYANWVWSDGNHPSIVIWDAMNEQKQDYIGNVVIPELMQLDPTRIWDAGYMSTEDLDVKQMEEIHWYPLGHGWWHTDADVQASRDAFRFGELHLKYVRPVNAGNNSLPMILNEYGWLWLNRDGIHSAIRTEGNFVQKDITPSVRNYEYFEPDGSQLYAGRDIYDYYLGKHAGPDERWGFQAYLLAIEGEILRSARIFSGIFSFVYLTDNGGYTGDWFRHLIRDLDPAQALLMQVHTCRKFAVFIDMEDGRYLKKPKRYPPGSSLIINLFGVNDSNTRQQGHVKVRIMDHQGQVTFTETLPVGIEPFWQGNIPVALPMPENAGGYMLISELYDGNDETPPQVSRRYFVVGDAVDPPFPEYTYQLPPEWPK